MEMISRSERLEKGNQNFPEGNADATTALEDFMVGLFSQAPNSI